MALTLALNTALSGLLASQKALNVVSQNITNVNTPNYTREVVNLQPETLDGQGAGVTVGAVSRPINTQLQQEIRTQNSTVGSLTAQQSYYQQIENLFGQVGDSTSLSSTIANLASSFNSLDTSVNDSSQQFATVQSALDVTNQMNSMTSTLQNMRLQADQQVASGVTQVNSDLTNISNLNSEIVNALSTNTDASALEDQRDAALNDLSTYMNVSYFQDGNGAINVYTGSGQVLVDTSQLNLLNHSATSITSATMTKAAGDFGGITVGSSGTDITSSITSGQLSALIQMRDTTIPNLQSELDQAAQQLENSINQVSNRGTTQPTLSNSYSGATVFATQGSITPDTSAESNVTLTYDQGTQKVTDNLTFSYSTTTGQPTVTGSTASSLAALTAGTTFTVGSGPNEGTYTVLHNGNTDTPPTNVLTISPANPVQTFSIANGADVAISIFDTSGNQVATTTLNTVMTTDYQGQQGLSATDPQAAAQASGGPWSLAAFSKHMQAWLQGQGYSGASVGLNSDGQMQISLGSTAQASLAFRDQTSGTPGATAQDATINFDTNGDGTTDQTVQGFANFFGLNNVFVNSQANAVMESGILPSTFTEPQTTPQRTLQFFDTSGQVGSNITIPAGSTLQDIANLINSRTQTTESAPQTSTSFDLTSTATFSVLNPTDGVLESQSFGPGTVSLQDIATKLTSGTVTAQVVQTGGQSQLRLFSSDGTPLTTSNTGGALSGSASATLSSQLDMTTQQHITATVIPEGGGERLQVAQSSGKTIYASANQDSQGDSIFSDLNLGYAASGIAGTISVRQDLQGNPSKLPTGAVQWNTDTGKYYLSEGDNTSTLQMAAAMTAKNTMQAAGNIGNGSYSLTDFTSSSIALVSQASSNVTSQQSYQSTLQSNLKYQYTSTTGVNIDEEVSNMMNYQQAYAASARVISTVNAMLSDLMDLLK